MYPNMYDLKYFVEIAQAESLSRAALRLGLSQPSLSQSLQRLEGLLNAKLFERSKKGVVLTPAGRNLFLHSKKLLEDWQNVQLMTERSQQEVRGQFKLGCHPSVALYSLPPSLPDLLGTHTELSLQLVHDLSRNIVDKVINSELDLAIAVNPVPHPDLVIKRVCEDQVGLWKATHLRAERMTLIADPSLLQTQAILQKLKKSDWRSARLIESSNLEVIAELTRHGVGCGILPGRVAQRVAGLKPVQGPHVKDQICIVYRVESRSIKAIQVIAGALSKAFS